MNERLSTRGTLAWAIAGGGGTGLLLYVASLRDYGAGDAGPVAEVVRESYLADLVAANAKLAALLVLAGAVHGLIAGVVVAALAVLRERPARRWSVALAGSLAFLLETGLALVRAFVDSPGSVVALWPYDQSRLDVLYERVSPGLVQGVTLGVVSLAGVVVAAALIKAARGRVEEWLAGGSPAPVPLPVLGAAGLGAALLLVASGAGAEPRRDDRPNVLVLMSDSLRADRIGAVREGIPVTPRLDALAARATSFGSCFTPVARTTEATVALMTGTWPQRHGIRTAWCAPEQHLLPVPALPSILRDAGYDTFATGDWNSSDFGRFAFGFDRVDVPGETWSLHSMIARGGRATAFLVRLHYGSLLATLAPEVYFYPGAHSAPAVTDKIARELERVAASGRPALIVGFYGATHAPFTAKGEHLRRFTDPAYHGPNRYCLMARTIDDAVKLQGETLRERDLRQVEGVYDASVRTFDDEIGAVLEHLRLLDLERRTIVVVTSDHGTAFYERGSFGQGNEVASDASNKIPLVIHDPRRPRASRVEGVVRAIDLVPTLCDLVGVSAPPSLEGRSLVPLMDDPSRDLGLIAYAETGLWISRQPWQSEELDFGFPSIYEMAEIPDRSLGFIATKPYYVKLMIRAQHRMVRDDRWKLLYVPTRHEPIVKLFPAGGGEDVAAEHPEVVARLRRELEAFLAREPADAFTMELPPPRRR